MYPQNNNRSSLGDHPLVVIISVFAALISIYVFITGRTSIQNPRNSSVSTPSQEEGEAVGKLELNVAPIVGMIVELIPVANGSGCSLPSFAITITDGNGQYHFYHIQGGKEYTMAFNSFTAPDAIASEHKFMNVCGEGGIRKPWGFSVPKGGVYDIGTVDHSIYGDP